MVQGSEIQQLCKHMPLQSRRLTIGHNTALRAQGILLAKSRAVRQQESAHRTHICGIVGRAGVGCALDPARNVSHGLDVAGACYELAARLSQHDWVQVTLVANDVEVPKAVVHALPQTCPLKVLHQQPSVRHCRTGQGAVQAPGGGAQIVSWHADDLCGCSGWEPVLSAT